MIFSSTTPKLHLFVAPNGDDSAAGTESAPMKTIQAAVTRAGAGVAVMVRAGEYRENVKLPSRTPNTPELPTWLVSADGPQAAKIIAATVAESTLYGYGTDNYVVRGFAVAGGKNGIQFSQSGSNFGNMVRNIVIVDNVITGSKEDGIKVSQADDVFVLGNTVDNVGSEGIDFVAVNRGVIAFNDVGNTRSDAAGIFAKGGSTEVLIAHNYVHDTAADGITVGGWTKTQFFRPGFTTYEAKDVAVACNVVERVHRRTVDVMGAIDSSVVDNYLSGVKSYYANVAIQEGWPDAPVRMHSRNIKVARNVFALNFKTRIHDGSAADIHDNSNAPAGSVPGFAFAAVGPEAMRSTLGDLLNAAVGPIGYSHRGRLLKG